MTGGTSKSSPKPTPSHAPAPGGADTGSGEGAATALLALIKRRLGRAKPDAQPPVQATPGERPPAK